MNAFELTPYQNMYEKFLNECTQYMSTRYEADSHDNFVNFLYEVLTNIEKCLEEISEEDSLRSALALPLLVMCLADSTNAHDFLLKSCLEEQIDYEMILPSKIDNKKEYLKLGDFCQLTGNSIQNITKILKDFAINSGKVETYGNVSIFKTVIQYNEIIIYRYAYKLQEEDMLFLVSEGWANEIGEFYKNGLYYQKVMPCIDQLIKVLRETKSIGATNYLRLRNLINQCIMASNEVMRSCNMVTGVPSLNEEAQICYILDYIIPLMKDARQFSFMKEIGINILRLLDTIQVTNKSHAKSQIDVFIARNFRPLAGNNQPLIMHHQGIREGNDKDQVSEYEYNVHSDGSFGDNNYTERGRYVSGASYDRMDDESHS